MWPPAPPPRPRTVNTDRVFIARDFFTLFHLEVLTSSLQPGSVILVNAVVAPRSAVALVARMCFNAGGSELGWVARNGANHV